MSSEQTIGRTRKLKVIDADGNEKVTNLKTVGLAKPVAEPVPAPPEPVVETPAEPV